MTGFVSAIGRSLPILERCDATGCYSNPQLIQTDAAINPGNSGGPLLDSSGRVIGVNDAISTDTGTFQGVGFAIPVNTVRNIVPQIIETGEVRYSYLGVTAASEVTLAELATEFDVPVTRGVLIQEVRPGGPADLAGLRGGTELVTFTGFNCRSAATSSPRWTVCRWLASAI
jgi:S1-C subfamily serine protease